MFSTIEAAISEIKKGNMIIVVDDENRENEGDFLMAAEFATPERINFMATHGRGLICMPMEKKILEKLQLNPMTANNTDPKETAFTISVDHVETITGISAHERALTVGKLIGIDAKASDFTKPGHIFPLAAKDGGVLERNGHTEAAVDLAKLAGLRAGGVICEIMNEDGTMARVADLKKVAETHKLKMITIEDLVTYIKTKGQFVVREAETMLPTKYGDFKLIGYTDTSKDEHHIALVKGDISNKENLLVRLHSECLTGDTFSSTKCDCGEQLNRAMAAIEKEGQGLIIYMKQEGRGIGIINKIKAYNLQDKGRDTVDANLELGFGEDEREYNVGVKILEDLEVRSIRLMTNNPDKINGLKKYGYNTVERVSIIPTVHDQNRYYLNTKKERMGHLI